jgi:hypothetical protein
LVAWHEKSSTENERTTVAIETLTHHKVVFRQIAGYVARRIVFYCNEGDATKAGHEGSDSSNSDQEWMFSCLWILRLSVKSVILRKEVWM